METYKVCSFFGHRKIEITEKLKQKLKDVLEDLITDKNVSVFLFGSRSEFDILCHEIVTELKEKCPVIKRVCYTCKNESCILESERRQTEKLLSGHLKKEVHILGYEEEFEHKTKYVSGRASYVERNQAMIDDSNYCIFYYDENYKPEIRKYSKNQIGYYQPKSGTKLAYDYAVKKNKTIYNIKLI